MVQHKTNVNVRMSRKIWLSILLAVISLGTATYSATVHSEESVGVMLASKHINAPNCKQYGTLEDPCRSNESNIGLSYNVDLKGRMYGTFGAYQNSFSRLSTHVGVGYRLMYGGIVVSAITGYPMAPVMPSVVPYFELPINDVAAIQFLMPFTPGTQQVLAVQFKYTL